MLNSSRSLHIFLRNSIAFSTPLRQVKTLSPKKLKEHNTVIIVSPTCVDYKNIANFMKENYFPNEPTCQALGVKGYTILLDHMMATLTQGLSLVAKNKTTGAIMGVALNEKTTPWDADLNDKLAVTIQCDNLKKLLHFYATLERAPNIFQKYNVSEVFEIANLAVSRDFRKMGIAKKLMLKSKEIAKKMEYEILRVDATSFYSAKICENMKMELIHEIPYKSYLDANRNPVFNVPLPHTGVKVYVSQLYPKKRHLEEDKKRPLEEDKKRALKEDKK